MSIVLRRVCTYLSRAADCLTWYGPLQQNQTCPIRRDAHGRFPHGNESRFQSSASKSKQPLAHCPRRKLAHRSGTALIQLAGSNGARPPHPSRPGGTKHKARNTKTMKGAPSKLRRPAMRCRQLRQLRLRAPVPTSPTVPRPTSRHPRPPLLRFPAHCLRSSLA